MTDRLRVLWIGPADQLSMTSHPGSGFLCLWPRDKWREATNA